MGKNFETKREIIESLAVHKRTLTDLSRQLGLSPSTVKQHLEELRRMGMVQFVEDMHLNRHKYYETVPGVGFGGTVTMAVGPFKSRVMTIRPIMAR